MLYCMTIKLEAQFVLAHQYDKLLPIEAIIGRLKCEVVSQSLTDAIIKLEGEEENECHLRVLEEFERLYPNEGNNITVTSELAKETPEAVLADIQNMVSWTQYKKLCQEIVDVSRTLENCAEGKAFWFQNYFFSVNSGYGLTTALNNLSGLILQVGAFPLTAEDTVIEVKLVSGNEPKYGEESVYSALEKLDCEDNGLQLVNFDISNFIEKSKHNELKEFLKKLVHLQESYIFSFSVPFLEKDALKDIRDVLNDVLFIREISVPPFSNAELKACAAKMLAEYGYSMDEEAGEILFARISEEKSDGRFYGIQTVKKIVNEMIWIKARYNTYKEPSAEGKVTGAEIEELSSSYKLQQPDGFDELAGLIGMEEISAKIREIVSQVKMSMNNPSMGRPCLHMRFEGAPGTGKTTVARIVGRIFRENGILRNGHFFEYSARSLCGEYVGQTAPRTSAICRDAYGSVLFIDEAYALYSGDSRSNDYGKEAITTLISEMETHRDDMVVIMAGYKEDMKQLMEANAGIRSRMPYVIEFKSYTNAQLFEIFMLMVKKHFAYTEEFAETAKAYFDSISDDYRNSVEFANARFVRNLYERTWSKAALRVSLAGSDEITLTKEDFETASAEKEFTEKLMVKRKLGF